MERIAEFLALSTRNIKISRKTPLLFYFFIYQKPIDFNRVLQNLMTTTQAIQNNLDLTPNTHAKINSRVRPLKIRVKPRISELQDYQLGEMIGEGGFGYVRKAIHIPTGETVAVKVCKTTGLDRGQIQLIEREIQLQRSLFHQNIAQIYEVIKTSTTIYIVMEYCQQGELFDRINRYGPMLEKDAASVFHQILSALLYLKQQKISHRDIKPENIMFHRNEKIKIIDFGFSVSIKDDPFRKTTCGTPSYVAPEILKHQSYDPELVDVWCLGVTLYAMLAAQLPFDNGPRQQRKLNILGFKYTPQPQLSSKAQKLFASIFVDAHHRPHLQDLERSQFALSYNKQQAMSIDLHRENVEVEERVINALEVTGVDVNQLTESIRKGRLNKYRPLYYLNLQKLQRIEPNQPLSTFKKEKRRSMMKLEPVSRTPSGPKKIANSNLTERQLIQLKLGHSFNRDKESQNREENFQLRANRSKPIKTEKEFYRQPSKTY